MSRFLWFTVYITEEPQQRTTCHP